MELSQVQGLVPAFRGMARDVYDLGEQQLLIVNTDRISAFDVVLPTPIPSKGKVLTRLLDFWFERTDHIIPSHRVRIPIGAVVENPEIAVQLTDRTLVARKTQPFKIDVTVRGYRWMSR